LKAEEEAKINLALGERDYFAENFVWEEVDGSLTASYNVFSSRVPVDSLLAAGDTGAAFERFMEMKFEDRQEFVQSAMYGGNYIDDSTLYFWDISSREAAGFNTRTPATWDSPEVVDWYQGIVQRSAVSSAIRQESLNALSSDVLMISKITGTDPFVLSANMEHQLLASAGHDVGYSGFSISDIEKQNKSIMNAVASGDSRVTAEGLEALTVFQNAALQGA
jgi:hypothetical protein